MSVQFRKIHGGTIFFIAMAIETTYLSTLQSILTAYEMKNNCSLFERLFKKKNDIFLFGISFFVLEILTFFYYAKESDSVIGCATKIAKC